MSVQDGDSERLVPIEELERGQVFVVRPGERVATDGQVVEGSSAVDLSLVTGESEPVEVGPGSAVIGGAVNAGGLLLVRATAVGADTQLARITRLVTEAQAGKARASGWPDSVAGVFVPVVLALAVTALGFWLGAGADPQAAITACVAVLVVACPARWARDPDRADGGHRPRCPARRPRHRAAGVGGASAPRRRRPRQDRHAHHGHMSVARITAVPDGLGRDAASLRLAGASSRLGTPARPGRSAYARRELRSSGCRIGASSVPCRGGECAPGRRAAGRSPRPGRRVARRARGCPAGGGGRRAHARSGPCGRGGRGADRGRDVTP
ncbi:hypothetical protein O1M63_18955 [Streptomyces mirabilis]|nr:hypothetical protein [Streptomyces mirabilis]